MIVVIFHDHGSRYLAKMFNDDWMREKGFFEKTGLTARDLVASGVSGELLAIEGSEPVVTAVKLMGQHDFSQISITHDRRLVGSLNETHLYEELLRNPEVRAQPVEIDHAAGLPLRGHLDAGRAALDDDHAIEPRRPRARLQDRQDVHHHAIGRDPRALLDGWLGGGLAAGRGRWAVGRAAFLRSRASVPAGPAPSLPRSRRTGWPARWRRDPSRRSATRPRSPGPRRPRRARTSAPDRSASVARPAAHHRPLLARRALHADDGAECAPVRLRPDGLHADPVVPVAAVVPEQPRRAVVVRDQHVEVAVAVVVGVGGAARRPGPPGTRGRASRSTCSNLPLPAVAEHQRRLLVLHLRLHPPDLLLDVAVGREDVEVAVEVVVEEEDAERQRQQARAADGGRRRLVDEQLRALVVVEREHLVREVADEQVRAAGAVVVAGVDAHRAARDAVLAVGHAGRDPLLGERAVPVVAIELVRLRVVGDEDVGPAVAVVIEDGDAERLARGIGDAGLLAHVLRTGRRRGSDTASMRCPCTTPACSTTSSSRRASSTDRPSRVHCT